MHRLQASHHTTKMTVPYGLTLTLALAICLGAADSLNPGSVVRITQKGLDFACQKGMSILQQELSKIQLPDFSGTHDILVFGKAEYNVSSLVISSFQISNSKINLVPSVGLKLTISWNFVQVDGRWKIHHKFMSENGKFNLKLNGLNASIDLKLGSNEQGKPVISPSNCSSHISDINVKFSGPYSWLINLFHTNIENKLRNSLEQKMCPSITDSLNSKLQSLLQTLPVTAKIDNISAIDYSLTGPPVVTAEYMDIPLKGEFFDISHRATPFNFAPALSLPRNNNLMVYFGVSDYMINSACSVYQSAGALVINITDDMIPKDFNVRMSTFSLGLLIPQVSELYPNMLVKLKISSHVAPVFNINPGNLTLSLLLDIQAYAILPNTSLAPLFLLRLTTNVAANVAINSSRIVGNVTLGSTMTTLKHSDVGPFSVMILNMAVNYCLTDIVFPKINDVLKEGYPLPLLDKLKLEDVVLELYEKYMLFGANMQF